MRTIWATNMVVNISYYFPHRFRRGLANFVKWMAARIATSNIQNSARRREQSRHKTRISATIIFVIFCSVHTISARGPHRDSLYIAAFKSLFIYNTAIIAIYKRNKQVTGCKNINYINVRILGNF